MIDKLKYCPFCGHDASVYRMNNGNYFAGCSTASDTCICGAGVIKADKESAVTIWNRKVEKQMIKDKK